MLIPSLSLARRAANGQATRRASPRLYFHPWTRRQHPQTNLLSSFRPHQQVSRAERRRQLSRECEFVIRSYVFVRCLTRPPDNLGMPLTLTPQSRDRFAPMSMPWYGRPNIAYAGEKASRRWRTLSGAAAEELPHARVERSSCSSVGGGADLDGV